MENLLRPAYYVPENKKAFDLLTELQAQHLRLALVVDEYGSLVGLVSVEDLLEELCGEIPQEFQVEEKPLGRSARALAGQGHHVPGGFQRGPGAELAHGGVRHHRRPGPEPFRGSAPGRRGRQRYDTAASR